MLTLSIFEKQGKVKWSKDTLTIVDKKTHSYKLDNGKWYRYYQLAPAGEVSKIERTKSSQHALESLRKIRTTQRRMRHEGVDKENIINHPRYRTMTERGLTAISQQNRKEPKKTNR